MNNFELNKILKDFNCNPPVIANDIVVFQASNNITLPQEYVDFLKVSDGGEGFIGQNSYVIFWKLNELMKLNDAYQVRNYADKLFLFGSNGGGEAFAFDTRQKPYTIVSVPFVGMDMELIETIGKTFWEFLEFLYDSN